MAVPGPGRPRVADLQFSEEVPHCVCRSVSCVCVWGSVCVCVCVSLFVPGSELYLMFRDRHKHTLNSHNTE